MERNELIALMASTLAAPALTANMTDDYIKRLVSASTAVAILLLNESHNLSGEMSRSWESEVTEED